MTYTRPTPEDWLSHRSRPAPDGGAPVGGSDLWRLLGLGTFSDTPTSPTVGLGHVLEPLIIARGAQILDLPPVESGWCVDEDYRRGSLDGLCPDVAIVEAKAVFAGQHHHWQRHDPADLLDGLAVHVRYQALWYAGIARLPVHIFALMIPGFGLDLPPERAAWQHELRIYTLDPAAHTDEIAELFATIDALRAAGITLPEAPPATVGRPKTGPILSGSFDDARTLARYAETRARLETATEANDRAREAVRALIPSDHRGIQAGGYRAILDVRGRLLFT